jgi:hypothetical protein
LVFFLLLVVLAPYGQFEEGVWIVFVQPIQFLLEHLFCRLFAFDPFDLAPLDLQGAEAGFQFHGIFVLLDNLPLYLSAVFEMDYVRPNQGGGAEEESSPKD